MDLDKLSLYGGLFTVFAFVHFFVDWIFQSQSEAFVKHKNHWVRFKHCIIYTAGFYPIFYIIDLSLYKTIICLNILFWSHFYLDTYHLVYLWAKYIRRPSEMVDIQKKSYHNIDGNIKYQVLPPDPKNGFVEFVKTPIGKILSITIDQISHLTVLWLIIYFIL